MYDINDDRIFNRLPKKELSYILRNHCPVPDVEKDELYRNYKDHEIKNAAKKLRQTLEISEEHVCNTCRFKDACKQFQQLPQIPKSKQDIKVKFSDLLVVLDAYYGMAEFEIARKQLHIDKQLEIQQKQQEKNQKEKDEKKLKEEDLYNFDEFQNQVKQEKNDKQNSENQKDNIQPIEQFEPLYNFKIWSSGIKVLDSCDSLIDDLKNNDGVETKKYLNLWQEFQYQSFKTYKDSKKQDKNSEKENKNKKQEPKMSTKKNKRQQDKLVSQAQDLKDIKNQNKNKSLKNLVQEPYLANQDINIQNLMKKNDHPYEASKIKKNRHQINVQMEDEYELKNNNQYSSKKDQNQGEENQMKSDNLRTSNRKLKQQQYREKMEKIKNQDEQEQKNQEEEKLTKKQEQELSNELLIRELDNKRGGNKNSGFKFTKMRKQQ
ncbi:hypothetical protein PPERSA_07800 [Pseudocohnilembus persalinus]|uniref:Uncharacterized protein n=1 Tax=Pseudocohnilembus persalinus TaxID=266149 RepID=A0A0V0QC70_PSEPJ|nr:hypothetical protein PPERSA_07800 [Pseudocohnilembus persalinus]|eukprot:KRW99723.1 hypothetical protein PPERSA_07800 [Pseudocohnilembus persalinus]